MEHGDRSPSAEDVDGTAGEEQGDDRLVGGHHGRHDLGVRRLEGQDVLLEREDRHPRRRLPDPQGRRSHRRRRRETRGMMKKKLRVVIFIPLICVILA